MTDARVRIFSTCPQSKDVRREDYLRSVIDVARWSEVAGCHGMLVYADNGLVDPWLVAQLVLEHTEALSPLVAVQPVYMHPYTVAKMVASLAHLHGRRIDLNMVAGGFRNDLLALGDETPHDERYDRVVEYTHILRALLLGAAPVTFEGRYYRVAGLRMTPALPPELAPDVLMSGSSDAGLRAARATGAIPVRYPEPPGEAVAPPSDGAGTGIRVGIIARETADEAWAVAHARFPEDRAGQLAHQLAMKVSDSAWHKQLSHISAPTDGAAAEGRREPYWLTPFKTYKTFCPYLVGTYADVAHELSRYLAGGVDNVILDIPPSREELDHIAATFGLVSAGSAS